jgi:hypothetical protein
MGEQRAKYYKAELVWMLHPALSIRWDRDRENNGKNDRLAKRPA